MILHTYKLQLIIIYTYSNGFWKLFINIDEMSSVFSHTIICSSCTISFKRVRNLSVKIFFVDLKKTRTSSQRDWKPADLISKQIRFGFSLSKNRARVKAIQI